MLQRPELDSKAPTLSFNEVRDMRQSYDYMICARAICQGNSILIQNIKQRYQGATKASTLDVSAKPASWELYENQFAALLERQRGYLQGFHILEAKISNAIQLVGMLHNSLVRCFLANAGWLVFVRSRLRVSSQQRSRQLYHQDHYHSVSYLPPG